MINHVGTESISLDRILLRRFNYNDAEAAYKNWTSQPEVTKYLTWHTHKDLATTQKLINMWTDNYKEKNVYHWAIVLKEIDEPIGSITMMNINDHTMSCTIGYCIGKEFWGKGLTREALCGVIDYGFNSIKLARIAAYHHLDNINSGKVMIKSGMTYEGILKKIVYNNEGKLVDCKCYAIIHPDHQ